VAARLSRTIAGPEAVGWMTPREGSDDVQTAAAEFFDNRASESGDGSGELPLTDPVIETCQRAADVAHRNAKLLAAPAAVSTNLNDCWMGRPTSWARNRRTAMIMRAAIHAIAGGGGGILGQL
jgi:hypothetical protein